MSRPRKPPAKITERYLRWVTGRYLERYGTTTNHLRRLLMQRVRRSATHHEMALEPLSELVDAEIVRLVRIGLLDDAAFAMGRVQALHRRGNGSRAIRAKLAAKGLRGEVVDLALESLASEFGDPELAAALNWARKRRLGPWAREQDPDPVLRRKQLARFGRAGFSYGIARRILEATTESEFEEEGTHLRQ